MSRQFGERWLSEGAWILLKQCFFWTSILVGLVPGSTRGQSLFPERFSSFFVASDSEPSAVGKNINFPVADESGNDNRWLELEILDSRPEIIGALPSERGGISPLFSERLPHSSEAALKEEPVPRFKPQAVQRVALSAGWLGALRRDELSQSFAETKVTVGIPLGSLENILAIAPGARIDWINAPGIEIPSTLYDFGIDLFHTRRINERWKFMGLVRPSLRSDLVTNRTPTRILALALLLWEAVPETATWSVGAVYLGRPDLPVLPAVGLIWTPDPTRKLELQFPRSRFFKRLNKDGARSELWANASIGIGGNTWAVLSENERTEEIALRDLRLTMGVEKIVSGGGGWFAETGWAFDRRLENLSNGSNLSLSNGLFISAGWAY